MISLYCLREKKMKEKLFLKCYQALVLLLVSFFITACGGDNVTPVATAQSLTVNEDTTDNAITLAGTDADGNSLTYTIATQPTNGTLSGTAPNVTYTPKADFFGTETFTFTVNDGTVDSAPATVTITVSDVAEPIVKDTKPWEHGKLKVSDDGHMLQHEDGTGFFWMADTAWFMVAKMSREEIDTYLTDRVNKGFTVVMINIMSSPWDENRYGDKPYPMEWPKVMPAEEGKKPYRIDQPITTLGNNPLDAEEYDYWDHVDYTINKAAEKGLYIGLVVTWRIAAVEYINKDKNLYDTYSKFLAQRYTNTPNIVWLNGGDVYGGDDKDGEDVQSYEVWDWIGEMIKAEDPNHLMSFHGSPSSAKHHNKEWLDFNMIESGHWIDSVRQNAEIVRDYNKSPSKPVVDGETRYEEIGKNLGTESERIEAFEVREIAYYQLFSGAFGHTYGHNSIWQIATQEDIDNKKLAYDPISTWEEALNAPGGQQMQYISELMQSRPIVGRVPDQSLIASGDSTKIRATRGDGYAFIYSTSGQTIEIALGKISGDNVNIWSYNPRTGEAKALKNGLENSGVYTFTPEGIQEFGNDWVVVIDDASKGYGKPGE